ncbi:hypothetical protein BGZ94_008011 [Podila epigama]|nr:hypothetical protein BGZ94_008011 [Podila epigama]
MDTNSSSVAIAVEKDPSVAITAKRSHQERAAVQRSLGFKNVVIYVLVFMNLVLCAKLYAIWSKGSDNSLPTPSGALWTAMHGEEEPEHEGGLTIGLMGLDETNLHVLMASGTPEEQVHAETVYKLLSRGKHWVLVTLLLGNVIVNETLPVVLDSELGGGVVAILIATFLIVVFGEIIPQAVCARYGLAIGSYCAKPMLVFMFIMSPVAYPIAALLDCWLGVHHGTTYRRTELKTLVSLHQMDGIGELTDDEVTIIASVLDLKEKPVSKVMTPLEDVFTLSEDAILDEKLMEEIVSAGYSRIPIYRHDDPSNFIGMLLVKRLITYDPEDHTPIRKFTINSLPEAAPNTSCLDILNFFQEGRSHMAIVTSEPGGFGVPVGVITLEDVIEELLGEEIVDESDVYVDIHNKIRVIRKPSRNAHMIKNLKSLLQSPALSDASTPLLTGLPARSSTLPIESSYMSTGKTILQPSKSSASAVHAQLERRRSHQHQHQASVGSHLTHNGAAGKDDTTPAKEPSAHHAVDFKDDVDVIKETVKPRDATVKSTAESQRDAVAIDVPEVGETYLINLTSDEATAAAVAAAAKAVGNSDVPTTAIITEAGPSLAASPKDLSVDVSASVVADNMTNPKSVATPETVVESPVEVPSTASAGLPTSESTATLLSVPATPNQGGASPASTSSKKKKNKKKKSNK